MSLSHTVHPSYSCTRAMTQPLLCSCPCLSIPYSSPKLQLYACHDSTIALLMSMSLSHTVHPSYRCTRAMTQPLPCSCPCLSLPYSSPKLQLYACHDSTIALLMSMSLSHTVHPSYSCTRATTQPLPCSCPCLSLPYSSPKLQLYACHDSTIALLMSMSLSHTVHPSYSCTSATTQPLPCSCPCLSLIQFTQVTAVRVPRLNHCPAHVHVSLPYSSPKLQMYACHDSTIALLMSMSLSLIQSTQVTAVRVPRLNHCPAHVHVSLSLTVHPSYSCTRAMTQPLPCSCPCLSLIQFTQVTAIRVPRLNHCPAHVHVSLSHTVHPSYSCTRAMTQPLLCSCPCLSLPYSSPKLQLYACHDSTIALLMSMSLSPIQFTQVTAVRVP